MIYLDNNATTQIDPRVLEAMMPFLTNEYGNAASNHEFGIRINQSVKEARASIASLINSEPHEIVFTSGATEAINLGLKGLVEKYPEKNHIVTVQTEHKAVLDVCAYLEKQGIEITYLPVLEDGLVDLSSLKESITDKTLVVSVMFVNNETGVIQPLKEIARIAHDNGAFFMTDATQAVGKTPVDVQELGIDIMAFSGHKFYGPKGIGGLYVRSRRPFKVKLEAQTHGGGHERNMRSGTINVPGIVGLGKAAEIAKKETSKNEQYIKELRDELEAELLKIPNSFINGSVNSRLYNTINICLEGANADAVMVGLKGIMISNGSACTSTEIKPSHVLIAMGKSEEYAYSSLRISFGKFNTSSDSTKFLNALKDIVISLKNMVS